MNMLADSQAKVLPLFGSAGLRREKSKRSAGSRLLLAAAVTLHRWQNRAAQRRILAGMSDYHLKDIGLSRADVEGEAAKPFWQG